MILDNSRRLKKVFLSWKVMEIIILSVLFTISICFSVNATHASNHEDFIVSLHSLAVFYIVYFYSLKDFNLI